MGLRARASILPFGTVLVIWVTLVVSSDRTAGQESSPTLYLGRQFQEGPVELPPGTGILPSRLALVIGVQNYANSGTVVNLKKLQRAAFDAQTVAKSFRRAGFQVTELITSVARPNITRNDILNAIEEMNEWIRSEFRKSGRHPIVAFYFAGHGLSTDGLTSRGLADGSFVLPSDFRARIPEDIPEMALSVEQIAQRLAASAPALRFLLLDACRDLLSFTVTPDDGKRVSISIGHGKISAGSKSGKPSDINNLYILYATSSGMKAADNGEFSGAIERTIDEKIKDVGSTKTGQQSALGDFKHRLYTLTQGAAGAPQLLDVVDDTPVFRLFSTREDFDREINNWKFIDKLNSETPQSALAMGQELWCRLDDMLNKFSYYSYLTPAVKFVMIDGYKNDCESVKSLRSTFASTKDIVTSSGRWNTARIEKLLSSESPPLKDVLPSNAAQLVGQLDTTLTADRLAVGASKTRIRRNVSDRDGFATLDENELVQILSTVDNGLIKIRTMTGDEGLVDARAVIAGRSAVEFSVNYKPGQVELESNRLPTGRLLRTSLITDVLVQYPETDGSIGFTRAQYLASLIEDASNGGGSGTRSKLVVSVRSIDAEQRKLVPLEANEVKVTLAAFPLLAPVRAEISGSSASVLPTSQSMGPSRVIETLNSVDKSDGSKDMLAKNENAVSAEVAKPGPIERCSQVGAQFRARFGTFAKKIVSYVQIAKPEQENLYNILAAGLRKAGSSVPAEEMVSREKAPTSLQVRYCDLGQDNKLAAPIIADLLNQCGLGNFEVRKISNPSVCKLGKVEGNVEIWFNRDP